MGLTLLNSSASTFDEWDDYEDSYSSAIERFTEENPGDPDALPFSERIRAWRESYQRWGRDTLGFGYYLFSTPPGQRPIAG